MRARLLLLLTLAHLCNGGTQALAAGIQEKVGASISMDVRLRGDTTKEEALGKLIGRKPTILSLVYYGCPSICGLLLSREAQALKALSKQPGKDYQILAVSIDPKEGPEFARRSRESFAKMMDRGTDGIRFLTGSEDQVRKLADEVGFDYSFDFKAGLYRHEAALIFLSSEGKIVSYLRGTGFSAASVEASLKEASGELSRPAGPGPSKGDDETSMCSPLFFALNNFNSVGAVEKHLAFRTIDQRKSLRKSAAFHDFHFTDRRKESGITFVHHAVEDSTSEYKEVHYDHGTGMAVADVDGDGLPDIYFVNQSGSNALWRNLGGGKFEDITEKAGVGLKGEISVAAAFGDFDNDGKPDLFVTTIRHGNHLFKNLGNGRFEDVTKQLGLDYSGHSSGAVWFDFNRDGFLDLLVTNVGRYTTDVLAPSGYYVGYEKAFFLFLKGPQFAEKNLLYLNQGGKGFKEVSAEMGLTGESWSGDAISFDANGDGFPDLYVLNMSGRNHLYINQGGKSFKDETEKYFPATSWGAMGAAVFDYNQDGNPGLYVTDMHSDMILPVDTEEEETRKPARLPPKEIVRDPSTAIFGNSYFKQKPDHSYEEISDRIGLENYWPWGPSVGDLNADGYDDVFVTAGMNFPFRYQENKVLLNEGGKRFVPAEFALGVEPRKELIQEWFSVNCKDKKNNIVCAACPKDSSGQAACPNTDLAGITHVYAAHASRSSVIFDVDGDGALDIVTNEFNAAPQVLMSDLARKKKIHWLKIRLEGTRSNRQGLGATVRLRTGTRWLTQFNTGKSGYLGQSDLPLYFGLGDAARADQLEIHWPSGTVQTVPGPIRSNTELKVVEKQ